MERKVTTWVDGRIDDLVIKPLKPHADTRGWLAELFRVDEISNDLLPTMGYVSMTLPGTVRGPHAHSSQTDYFGFVGPGRFMLRVWDNRPGSATYGHRQSLIVGTGNPVVAVVPPGIVHAYRNISDTEGYVLNFPNRLYAGRNRKEPVDEVRHENQQPCVFSMED